MAKNSYSFILLHDDLFHIYNLLNILTILTSASKYNTKIKIGFDQGK